MVSIRVWGNTREKDPMHSLEDAGRKSILVIDDDERLQGGIKDFLQSSGFEVRMLLSGKGAVDVIRTRPPDIVLLDVMLPGDDGFTVLRHIRNISSVPVIMLTARGEDTDRIVGLELGADDYLSKPFNPRELFARIKAVLRRFSPDGHGAPAGVESAPVPDSDPVAAAYSAGEVRAGMYVLETKRQRIRFGDKSEALSTAEFCILHTFMTHPGGVLSRDKILALSFGREEYANSRNIDVYISRLRTILRKLGDHATRIRTVWGTGYCWIKDE